MFKISTSRSLPRAFRATAKRCGTILTEQVLWVRIKRQELWHYRSVDTVDENSGNGHELKNVFIISTSRFGIGQVQDSNCTPLGLHLIAEKIGADCPVGTVFKARQSIGYRWKGMSDAKITTRILC